jgi:hypothetical protein
LTLDPATRFASLQTGRSGNRTILFATSENAPGQLDSLLDWLDGDVRRWSTLEGTAVISMQGRDPVEVNTETAAPPEALRDSGVNPLWWVAAGVGVVIGVGAAAMAFGRVRRG